MSVAGGRFYEPLSSELTWWNWWLVTAQFIII